MPDAYLVPGTSIPVPANRCTGAVAPEEVLVTGIPGPAAIVIEVETGGSGVPDACLIGAVSVPVTVEPRASGARRGSAC